jgi:hypothetical protein
MVWIGRRAVRVPNEVNARPFMNPSYSILRQMRDISCNEFRFLELLVSGSAKRASKALISAILRRAIARFHANAIATAPNPVRSTTKAAEAIGLSK